MAKLLSSSPVISNLKVISLTREHVRVIRMEVSQSFAFPHLLKGIKPKKSRLQVLQEVSIPANLL